MVNVQISPAFETEKLYEMILGSSEKISSLLEIGPDKSFSIVIDDQNALKELNQQFRDIDAPTDVLSFPADEFDPDINETYIGDIIISHPQAELQAKAAGHETLEEIQLLIIHGVLHLIGYDHACEEEKKDMWKIQNSVLKQLGLSITSPEINNQ